MLLHLDGILPPIIPTLVKNSQVHYMLGNILLNTLINKKITIAFKGFRVCLNCDIHMKSVVGYSYCYKCSISLASCDTCMFMPHKCHYHLGTCREPAWGLKNCFIPNYVYVAYTSALKIGVTRMTNIPKRWIDQGAIRALPVFVAPNRRVAGLIEHYLKSFYNDKTHWQKMLQVTNEHVIVSHLNLEAKKIIALTEDFITCSQKHIKEFEHVQVCKTELLHFNYPIDKVPKTNSLNLEKVNFIEGTILGIKGQYMILDTGVFKWANFVGCRCEVKII